MASQSRLPDRVAKARADEACDEHDPEVGGVVLPVPVEIRRREEDAEDDERHCARRKNGEQMPAVFRPAAGHLVDCPRAHLAEHDA